MNSNALPSGWQLRRLESLISWFDAGVSVNSDDRPAMPDEFGVLKVSAVTEGVFRPSENKVISATEHRRACVNPKKDRLIMSRANTPELVGATAYIGQDYPNLFLSDKLWQFEPRNEKEISMRWLGQLLASPDYRKRLGEIATGSSRSMKNISQEAVMHLELPVPKKAEQEVIASALSLWDAAIEKTERLIAVKVRRNESLSTQLLFGIVRLGQRSIQTTTALHWFSISKDWHVVEIGEIAHEVLATNISGENLPVLSCTKYDGLVDSLKYFDKQIFSHDTTNYKTVRRGQFAYATNHIEEGSIGYQGSLPAGLVSPIYTVFQTDTKRIDHGYLYKLLKTEKLRQIFAARTNSSVDRRGSLRWKDFARIEIPLPSLSEQRQISGLLDNAWEEINLLNSKVALLRKQKRGLMQKLLTGQWRIKTPETEAA